ncbi:MAG: hypothetical protein EZS28_025243 [Streblomastix strix]|uniref:Uncharacterized protein n=1 Tax=Streblomastix strix TaxID=222440 RepID=A0A5J4V9P6_9EUKA|nr:MAG: hypothetical protein EZS28_025243 [Streblomastix strix]
MNNGYHSQKSRLKKDPVQQTSSTQVQPSTQQPPNQHHQLHKYSISSYLSPFVVFDVIPSITTRQTYINKRTRICVFEIRLPIIWTLFDSIILSACDGQVEIRDDSHMNNTVVDYEHQQQKCRVGWTGVIATSQSKAIKWFTTSLLKLHHKNKKQNT